MRPAMIDRIRTIANHVRAIAWSVVLIWAAVATIALIYEAQSACSKWIAVWYQTAQEQAK